MFSNPAAKYYLRLTLLHWALVGLIIAALPSSFLAMIALRDVLAPVVLITMVGAVSLFWCITLVVIAFQIKRLRRKLSRSQIKPERLLAQQLIYSGLAWVIRKLK